MPDVENITWVPLTNQDFVAPNGYTVSALANTAELAATGDVLLNGLGDYPSPHFGSMARKAYADEALAGRFQVVQVISPEGEVVAVARLYVRPENQEAPVGVRFVRGHRNRDIPMDEPAGEAVNAYVGAVNARVIPCSEIGPNGFAQPARVVQEMAPAVEAVVRVPRSADEILQARIASWNEQNPDSPMTVNMARARGWAHEAFLEAQREAAACVAIEIPEIAQDVRAVPVPIDGVVQVGPGITASFINSVENLKHLGMQLETGLLVPGEAERVFASLGPNKLMAQICRDGAVEAIGEFTVRNGTVFLESLSGYAGSRTTDQDLIRAGINLARQATANIDVKDVMALDEGEAPKIFIQNLMRQVADDGQGYDNEAREDDDPGYNAQGYDDDVREGELDDEEGLEWPPLVEGPVYAANGLRVEFVGSTQELAAIGRAMNNPLTDPSVLRNYAEAAGMGDLHHYKVMRGDEMVACGSMKIVDGHLHAIGTHDGVPFRPLGPGNEDASPAANMAIMDVVQQVNARRVPSLLNNNGPGYGY